MTTDEGRELLCNIQGPIAARLIAISQARSLPAALRTSYQFFDDLLARFAVLPTPCRKWPGHRHSAWVCRIFSGRPRTGRSYRVARNGGLHDARPIIPGSGQRWKTAFKTPMIASGDTANELHG